MTGIASLADYKASLKERLFYEKAGGISTFANTWNDYWFSGGSPAAGSDPANTANGIVPDNTTIGAIAMPSSFSGTGYISEVQFSAATGQGSPVRFMLYDRLFHCGIYGAGAAAFSQTLSAQPSYSARIPGSDYHGLLLLIEATVNGNGTSQRTVTVTYTDQDGNAGASVAFAVNAGSAFADRWDARKGAFAPGDNGLQKIESVSSSDSTGAPAVSFVIARPLWQGVAQIAGKNYIHRLSAVGMPQIFSTSCLSVLVSGNAAANSPVVELSIEIASA